MLSGGTLNRNRRSHRRPAAALGFVLAATLAGCSDASPGQRAPTRPDPGRVIPGRVVVESSIYDQQGPRYSVEGDTGWEISPTFLVKSADPDRAAKALDAAGARFFLVDEFGRELSDYEVSCEAPTSYTPNFISHVYLTKHGPALWTDTKGGLSDSMGASMLRILVAELHAEGISATVTAPPALPTWLDAPAWQPAASGAAPKPEPLCAPAQRPLGDGSG